MPALGLCGGAAHQVIACVHAELDRVRVTGLEGLEHEVRVGVHDQVAVGGVIGQADHFAGEVTDTLVEAEADLVQAGGGVAEDVAAGDVDVAGNRHEIEQTLAGLHAVCLLVDGKAPANGGRLGLGVQVGGLDDLLDGNAGDLCRLLRGHALLRVVDTGLELVKAVAPALDEIMVVEVVVDDDGQHAHGERGVGAGTQAQVDIGARGQPVHAGVDGDQASAAAHHVDDGVAEEAIAVGCQRHLAPHDHALRKRVVGIVKAAGQ